MAGPSEEPVGVDDLISAFHAYAAHSGECQILLFPSTDERHRCTCGLVGWVDRIDRLPASVPAVGPGEVEIDGKRYRVLTSWHDPYDRRPPEKQELIARLVPVVSDSPASPSVGLLTEDERRRVDLAYERWMDDGADRHDVADSLHDLICALDRLAPAPQGQSPEEEKDEQG